MESKKLICAHYLSNYLPLTENWIYKILTNHNTFYPILISRKQSNLNLFPIGNLHSLTSLKFLPWIFQIITFKLLGYIPFFYKICKKHNAAILHIHFGYHGVKSIGLKKKLNIPMICSFYGGDAFMWPEKRSMKRQYIKLFQVADRILVLGQYMKNKLIDLGCQEEKIIIQHLGIDTTKIKFVQRENIPKNGPIRFLMASSFVEKKGIDIALKSISYISQNFNVRLDIIGDGPLKKNIQELIENLDLKNIVTLHGYKPYDFFIDLTYQCDAFIQSSKTTKDNDKEGTPMAIVDAMATGLPIISTFHSDIPEIVVDKENGYLAKENDVKSLAKSIVDLITDKNYHILSINCRKRIEEEFDAKKQTLKLEEIYQNLIN